MSRAPVGILWAVLLCTGCTSAWRGAPLARGVRVGASVDVPLLTAAPDLTRGAEDAAWKRACRISGFCLANGRGAEPAEAATTFHVARTAERLWLLVCCREPKMDAVRAKVRRQDGPVYADDSIEVFLMASTTFGRYAHLAANTAGVRYDARFDPASEDVDRAWTCDWRVRVRHRPDGFDYTVSIPLAAIGPVVEGGAWRLNVCRNRPRRGGSAWCATYGSFHTPRHFGHARFAKPLAMLEGSRGRSVCGRPVAARALTECDHAGRRTRWWWTGALPADGTATVLRDARAAAAVRRALRGAPADGRVRITLFDATDMKVLARGQWRPPRAP